MSHPPTQITASSLRCMSCGYDLTGATIGSACPECGTPIERSIRPQMDLQSNGTATACMILGILSLTVCGVLGPVAIGLYYSAQKQMAGGGYATGSQSMAKAGLIMGVISTALTAIVVFFVVVGAML